MRLGSRENVSKGIAPDRVADEREEDVKNSERGLSCRYREDRFPATTRLTDEKRPQNAAFKSKKNDGLRKTNIIIGIPSRVRHRRFAV